MATPKSMLTPRSLPLPRSLPWPRSLLTPRSLPLPRFPHATVGLALVLLVGCADDSDAIKRVDSQRQIKLQAIEAQQDYLAEAFGLLDRLVELNEVQSRRQIVFYLNKWSESRPPADVPVTELTRTVRDTIPIEQIRKRTDHLNFVADDVNHIRDAFLFRRVYEWADREGNDDPLLADWLTSLEQRIGEESAQKIRTAARLFDWTVRNISHEPVVPTDRAPPVPSLDSGLRFRGPGYRQTDYESLLRGTGDALQRAGVFTKLCQQASIPAFVLALQANDSGFLSPWAVGVLVDQEIYLFEPGLGLHIPGPGLVGVATLRQARRDASVMRRLSIPGFFDYPLGKSDIQQNIALLNLLPESVSPRMKQLEAGLTGELRMRLFADADAMAEQIDAVPGIAGVRLWNVPLLAELYARDMAKVAERDPLVSSWMLQRWGVLEMTPRLLLGRWRHLQGMFDNDQEEDLEGARALYLSQRAPEFEIEDLRIDVDLQKQYGVRRELGMSNEEYDRQIKIAQKYMRQAKRLSTYWISMIQYDDGRYDDAKVWFSKRVLDEKQVDESLVSEARFNLARTLERLGEYQQAIEIYKTEGEANEHGNRLRARLVGRAANVDDSESEVAPSQDKGDDLEEADEDEEDVTEDDNAAAEPA